MVKTINNIKINFDIKQKSGKPVVVIYLDDFEDIIEETDSEFKNSLKKSLAEYKKGEIVALEDLK